MLRQQSFSNNSSHILNVLISFWSGRAARAWIFFSKDEIGWLVLRLATFTPREIPQYSFYRRLSGPQDQSRHEGIRKKFHPSGTWNCTWAVQPIAKRLAAWATWPTIWDARLYFPSEGSHTQDFYALKKSIDPSWDNDKLVCVDAQPSFHQSSMALSLCQLKVELLFQYIRH